MDIRNIIVLLGCGLLVQCSFGKIETVHHRADGSVERTVTMGKDEYVLAQQTQRRDDKEARLFGLLEDCSITNQNVSGDEYNACRMGNANTLLAIMLLRQGHRDPYELYLQDKQNKRGFYGQLTGNLLAFFQPFIYTLTFGPEGAYAQGGGNYIKQEYHEASPRNTGSRDDSETSVAAGGQPETSCINCVGVGQNLDRSWIGFDAKGNTRWTEGGDAFDARNSGNQFQGDQNAPFDADRPDVGINPF